MFDGTNECGESNKALKDLSIVANYRTKKPLDHTLEMRHKEAWRFEYRIQVNFAIVALANGKQMDRWTGPVVVFARHGINHPDFPGKLEDVTAADLTSLYDYFTRSGAGADSMKCHLALGNMVELEHMEPKLFEAMLAHHVIRKYKGMEMTCEGDRRLGQFGNFIPVEVPDCHPVFMEEETPRLSSISVALNFPLFVRPVVPVPTGWEEKATREYPGFMPFSNTDATALCMNVNPLKSGFGLPNPPQHHSVTSMGRTLVVRQDKKEITTCQVEALVGFYTGPLAQLFARDEMVMDMFSLSVNMHADRRTEVFGELVCRAAFEEYFEEYKTKKIAEGVQSWVGAVSPYAV